MKTHALHVQGNPMENPGDTYRKLQSELDLTNSGNYNTTKIQTTYKNIYSHLTSLELDFIFYTLISI